MRQVLSLSLTQKTTQDIKALTKARGFASVSAYVKYLAEMDKELISETELLGSIKQARKEYRGGKSVTAESMADLL
jgi:Arc/MetJ-type ribon-helix-helix transcriptional regulator